MANVLPFPPVEKPDPATVTTQALMEGISRRKRFEKSWQEAVDFALSHEDDAGQTSFNAYFQRLHRFTQELVPVCRLFNTDLVRQGKRRKQRRPYLYGLASELKDHLDKM